MGRCGKPYGEGLECLDTDLTLVAPSGAVETTNHQASLNDFVGSAVGTYWVGGGNFFTEDGSGSLFTSRQTLPHVLRETGTYTIVAAGSVAEDGEGKRIIPGIGLLGGYYLQLLNMGTHTDVVYPHCPPVPNDAAKASTRTAARISFGPFTTDARAWPSDTRSVRNSSPRARWWVATPLGGALASKP